MPQCDHRSLQERPNTASGVRNPQRRVVRARGFWLNAVSNLGIVGALLWWRSPRNVDQPSAGGALRQCHSHRCSTRRNNPHLQATLIRAAALFLFASAYWALLPLVAAHSDRRGQDLYGYLLGAISAAAVGAALGLPRLNRKQGSGPDRLVAVGTLGTTSLAIVLFAFARDAPTALKGSVVAGASWIAVLTSLHVSAQVALPEWVRGLLAYVHAFVPPRIYCRHTDFPGA